MNHLEFAALESSALRPTDHDRWFDAVENALGFDLDGDGSDDARNNGTSDGYSMDFASDAFDAGVSVTDFVRFVRYQIARRSELTVSAERTDIARMRELVEFLGRPLTVHAGFRGRFTIAPK